jgi:3-oxoadipate enol-lactonase
MGKSLFTLELAQGPGAPVVLSHALGLDHSMWFRWAATQQGLRPVLAYDHRGHGKSCLPSGELSIQSMVDDAAELIRAWDKGPVLWLGLSMGAMVGQGLAIQHPDLVRSAVLAHTTACYSLSAQAAWAERIAAVTAGGMGAVVEAVTQRYLSADFRAANTSATNALQAQLLGNDPVAYSANCAAIAQVNWLDQLHRIHCPVLVIAGALDQGATPAMGQEIQSRIAGARLEVIEGAAHLSSLEKPEQFDHVVGRFLQ